MELVFEVGRDPNKLRFERDGKALSVTFKADLGIEYPFSVHGDDLETLRKILDQIATG
jgi:hypothetical protein